MMTTYYEELRRVHEEIKKLDEEASAEWREEQQNRITETVQQIIDLAMLARKEGLLALEEEAENMEDIGCSSFAKLLIFLVLDGTDPEDVRSIGLARYYCSHVKDYEALTYLLYLEGALAIQAGINPRLMEEKIIVMLPNEAYDKWRKKQAKELQEMHAEPTEEVIARLCTGKRMWNPGDNGYFVMKLADYAICDTNDMGIQRILREIDNVNLVVAMKGLSGDARRRIFDNLSERLAQMVAEDMEGMGPVRALDVLEAVQKILITMIRLVDNAEIVGKYEYLEPFYDMFSVDAENAHKKELRFDKLKQIVKEYEEVTRHSIT